MPTNFDSWMNGEEREPFDVPTTDTALIIVDMQNSFCLDEYNDRPEGRSIENFKKAVPGCVALLEAARAAGHMVIMTRYVHMFDNIDEKRASGRRASLPPRPKGLMLGTPGIEIIDELAPLEGEFVIDKSRPSSFYGTRLEPLLTANKIQNVIICGVTTNICVETTARDANQRGYDTYVVEDATGEFEESRHWHALYTIAWSFGTVVTVEDVQRSWGVPITMPARQFGMANA
jgi:ureidoacrylate peracid hydrolase